MNYTYLFIILANISTAHDIFDRKLTTVNQSKGGQSLRVLQFNMLADQLSGPSAGFGLSFKEATDGKMEQDPEGLAMIKWEARGPRIVEVILSHKPDIVTLQEVDDRSTTGFGYLHSELAKHGYDGDFSMSSELTRQNKFLFGNAIFYRKELLRKTESETIPMLLANKKDAKQNAMYSRLQIKSTKEEIVVACLHLRSGTDAVEVADRQAQAEIVIKALPSDIPLIIGADLNSPDIVPKILDSSLEVANAYAELPGGLAWTTWKNRVGGEQADKVGKETKHVIDYIFSTSEHFRVLSLLDIPADEEIEKTASGKRTLLPHERYPSDHMSIMAELELRPRATKGAKVPKYDSSACGYSAFFGTILAVAVMLM